jgi:hypothetical protein
MIALSESQQYMTGNLKDRTKRTMDDIKQMNAT